MTLINYKVPLKENGQNKNIKVATLDESILRKFGFTDSRKGYWYYCRNVHHDKKFDDSITFNISFRKKDGKELMIDILDEDFCQPYDYQKFLKNNPDHEYALEVHKNVQEIMSKLMSAEIITGYKPNDYI